MAHIILLTIYKTGMLPPPVNSQQSTITDDATGIDITPRRSITIYEGQPRGVGPYKTYLCRGLASIDIYTMSKSLEVIFRFG